MVNRQWLTPPLTTTFAQMSQLVEIQITFVKSFFDKISQ